MAKRMQEEKGEERSVAKSKPTLNLVSHAATSSSTVQSPIATKSLGTLRAPCQQDWKSTGKPVAREPNQKDAASSSQVWQKDAEMDKSTRRLAAAEKDQELLNFHENLKSTRKLAVSGNSDIDGNGTIWTHNLQKSTTTFHIFEKVLSNVRQRYGRKPGDKMEDLDVTTIVWRMFMSVTLQAALHFGKDFSENSHSIKNQPMRSLKQLFHVTVKLIRDHKEISGIPVIDWKQLMWQRTTLLTDRAVQFATAKTFVFSDSVLCMGGISPDPVKAWKEKIDWFMHSSTGSRWSSSGRFSQDSLH